MNVTGNGVQKELKFNLQQDLQILSGKLTTLINPDHLF